MKKKKIEIKNAEEAEDEKGKGTIQADLQHHIWCRR